VELVAVCDIVEEKAAKFAQANGITKVFTDYKKMMDAVKLDAVGIATPNYLHSEIAVEALNRGLNVFCEKPDAVSPAEAQRMADAAGKSGKLLMVMRNNRFNPASVFLRKYIQAGHMGDIYTGRCGWIRRRGIPGAGGWFTTQAQSGGGPLIDLGVHIMDLSIWLMGNPKPVSVMGASYRKFAESKVSDSVHSAFGETKVGGTFDVEDLASGFVRFDNGATLQIEFSWASNIENERVFIELRGSQAGLTLDMPNQLKIFTELEGTLCDVLPRIPDTQASPHAANINHFVDCLQGKAEPTIRPEHGVDMIKILSAIYQSAKTGQAVTL
jgi:predicted dehydrogenase